MAALWQSVRPGSTTDAIRVSAADGTVAHMRTSTIELRGPYSLEEVALMGFGHRDERALRRRDAAGVLPRHRPRAAGRRRGPPGRGPAGARGARRRRPRGGHPAGGAGRVGRPRRRRRTPGVRRRPGARAGARGGAGLPARQLPLALRGGHLVGAQRAPAAAPGDRAAPAALGAARRAPSSSRARSLHALPTPSTFTRLEHVEGLQDAAHAAAARARRGGRRRAGSTSTGSRR